jgi:serine protease Do
LRKWGTVPAAAVVALSLYSAVPLQAQDARPQTQAPMAGDLADLVQARLPAVVNISTTQKAGGSATALPEMQMPPGFEDFMKRFGNPMERRERGSRAPRANALGSGFIIDPAGYVVTNNHVVAEADEIKVILQDGVELPAKLVGRDARTDVALLKVDSAKPLPALAWGDSDKTRVGESVFAIGNPFGLGGTVTSGIVSARARDINAGPYDDFLQTDAAINRGNSGGPLFNMRGEVIGVNTAIFSPTGGNVGIGFAVPAAVAQNVVNELREHGKVSRGFLGVNIQRVTDEIAQAMGLKENKGALVSNVTEGSPAAKAGVKTGDVIVGFNGKDVPDVRALQRMVAATDADKSVQLTVLRNGKQQELSATIAQLKDAQVADAGGKAQSGEKPTLGLALAPLTPAARAKYELGRDATGVVVVEVAQDSVAARRGIQAGDLIKKVGDQEVTTPDDVKAEVDRAKKAKQNSVLALIDRDGQNRFVALPLGNAQG